ncbi:nucleotidyltransferase domain-containing protein [Candidatus Pacearchaeota archaeon]|nr:nucleotidyltransferase domain-containing protein [Candidatus Pacearchaeota archaeon]
MKKITELKEKILKIFIKSGVRKAGIFGSYIRGEQKKDSDIDLLIETPADFSLLDFVGLKLELEKTLNLKVDLVDYRTIKERLKERILNEEVKLI